MAMRKLLILIVLIFSITSIHCMEADTVMVMDVGTVYVGKYPIGKGALYSNKSGLFIGSFKNALPNGVCTHYPYDGDKYYGEFIKGKYSGQGQYFSKSGKIYVGEFMNGYPNGIDTIYYKKSIYVGECKDGVPHGKGIMYTYHNGSRKYYFKEGEFVNGKLDTGFQSSKNGQSSVLNGSVSPANRDMAIYSQDEIASKYVSLLRLKPIFEEEKLTKDQKEFLIQKKIKDE